MRWSTRGKIHRRIGEEREKLPSYPNPLFGKETWFVWVQKNPFISVLFAVVCVLGVVYFFFYSPIFLIQNISVQGVHQERIVQLVKEQMERRRWGIGIQKNMFTFSSSMLTETIGQVYSLEQLKINKKVPRTLEVTLAERTPVAELHVADVRLAVDGKGLVSQVLNGEETLPVILFLDSPQRTPQVGESLIPEFSMQFILAKQTEINSRIEKTIEQWVLIEGTHQLRAKTSEGWQIYFDYDRDLQQQYDSLIRLWDRQFKADSPNEYIDVRLIERVYYK
ncbi:MAG: hypothetical protein WC289_02870 [Patescibacteria group bacterium]|jgi:cell division septal protein FtsQ